MFIKQLEKKSPRTLLLFKDWFEKSNSKRGRIFKWPVFIREWTEEHQMNEFRDFFFETTGDYLTCKMLNRSSFKLVVNKKIFPRTFKTPTEAYKFFIEKNFKLKEAQLIREEKVDPKKLAEAEKRKKQLLQAKAEQKKVAEEKKLERINQYQASIEKRKDFESTNTEFENDK